MFQLPLPGFGGSFPQLPFNPTYAQGSLFPAPPSLPAPPANFLNALPTSNALATLPSPPPAPPTNFINALPRVVPNYPSMAGQPLPNGALTRTLPEGLGELGTQAAAGTGRSFIPSTLAPSASGASATGRLAFLRNGAGGLRPGLALAAAGLLEKGTGDYLRSQGHEGAGGALGGAGTVTTLAAPLAMIPGVAAAPVAGVAAAGGALGDIGASLLANPLRRAMGKDELQNAHLSNLTDPGGALSWLPVVGGGSGPAQDNRDLSAEGLKAKLDSFQLPPELRDKVKGEFNKYASDLRAQGVSLEDATKAAYAKYFEPQKDEKGNITQNALALQARDELAAHSGQAPEAQQQAALQQIQSEAARAAAFQAMLSQMAPDILGPDVTPTERQWLSSLPALYGANQAQIAQAQAAQAQAEYQKADLAAQLRAKYAGSGTGSSDLASLLGE